MLLTAIFFFSKSQDEYSDYLRIYHGCWHLVIGSSSMYTWQLNSSDHEVYTIAEALSFKNDKVFAKY